MFFYTFMPKLFNMSLTASVAIVLVILLRLLLKKAPKVISYALWGVVLFRLLCPVSIGSSFSLYNLFEAPTEQSGTMTSVIEYVPSNIVRTEYPSVALPVPGISDVINEALPQGEEQLRADPLEGPIFIATYVWMTGVLVMAIYSIVSYIQLRHKLAVVVPLRDNIFIADDIKSPFVVGLFRPRIYLPCNLDAKEQEYIILHEQHHIKRLDHVTKALAFLALAIHWFNPLVWMAFILSSKDMEMSCDEAVIRRVGGEIRADYSASLLTLATGRRVIAGTPLAFGEGDTKGRIRNLANWRKPAIWVVLIAVIACVALAAGLLTNPSNSSRPDLSLLNYKNAVNLVIEQDEIMAIYCPSSDETGSKIQIGAADGKELAKYINQWDWKQCKAPRNSLSSPGSVEFVIDNEYRITVYHKKSGAFRQYAVVKMQDDVRYYSIGRNDYADAVALVHAPAKITEGAVAGKTYVYENKGIMGDFTMTLYEDGTFNYYEGMASSYLGVGTWKQDGDTITLTDDGHGGYGLVNHFKRDGDDLVFIAEDSYNFVYVKVKNGERFHYTGGTFKPNSGLNGSDLNSNESDTTYDRVLSPEEIEQVNAAFSPIVFDKQGDPIGTNVWSCFFTSYYADVRDMNFAEFLAYFPGDGSTVDETEFSILKEQEDFLFYGEVSSLADMPVPVHRYPVRIINLVLNEYAGITVDDLNTSGVNYLAEYDAFYNYTSDAGHGMFICTRGEIDGDIVRLYEEFDYGTDVLTLRKEGNKYRILSHLRLDN